MPVFLPVTIASFESSIHSLCERLDALMQGVVAEIELHQSRIQQLRENSQDADEGDEVKGAVMASAIVLLQAVESLEAQLAEVRGLIDEQQRLLADLHLESRTDVLTGLLNRRAFDEELARRSAQARRSGEPLSLLMIDIDDFKSVNDHYGHAAGDKVLRGVANLLANSLREMDVVARYGGEEFTAILPDTNLLNACRAAERARTVVGTGAIGFDEHELGVTISIGVALVDGDAGVTLRRADDALYAAKRAGRNRVFVLKDGYCQPLEQEAIGTQGAQRRRWMRFLIDGFAVRLRTADGAWHKTHVQDESLTGLGVVLAEAARLACGDEVEIDYAGELRRAEVMNIRPHDEGDGLRVGLRWVGSEA